MVTEMQDRSSTDKEKTPAAKRGVGNRSKTSRGRGPAGPDLNEIAFRVAQQATTEADPIIEEQPQTPAKNPAAVTLGRLGGLKGGKARAEALTPEKRAEIAARKLRRSGGDPIEGRRHKPVSVL